MRCVALVVAVVACVGVGCGGPQRGGGGGGGGDDAAATAGGAAPAADARTPIERRRDAACERLGPKITACAVVDARADLAAGKIDQRQFARDTAPEIQQRNTEEFERACKKAQYSSRQVRVLEVCLREETECAPLVDCLGHLSDRAPAER